MTLTQPKIIDDWNNRYFDGELSADFLDALAEMPTDRQDVVEFLERFFRTMHHGRFRGTDLSPFMGTVLGTLIARVLPGDWSGRVPPITVPGRHVRIDEYVLNNRWRSPEPGLFLDIGCGFPPATTFDTAQALPDWRIVAADPSTPACVVYDNDDNYATFDADGEIVYYQPVAPTIERWNALVGDRAATEARFRSLRAQLLPSLGGQAEVAQDGARLVDPVRLYSVWNLSFQAAGIGEVDIEEVDVIRCLNVLYYFDPAFRQDALKWFSNVLTEGGLLLVGGDWCHSNVSRYTVYQKADDHLVAREFAFSIDNLCPPGPVTWFMVADDDHETVLLADLTRVLRGDADFLRKLYEVSDALRAEHDLFPRNSDGYYDDVDPSMEAAEFWGRARDISRSLDEELAPVAVECLQAHGYDAWVNDIGHVAVGGESQ